MFYYYNFMGNTIRLQDRDTLTVRNTEKLPIEEVLLDQETQDSNLFLG